MSGSNCCFLTCIHTSQEAGQVVWYSHLLKNFPQFVVIYTVKGFGVINKAEVDVFPELSRFFNDPTDVVNLISGSFAFSKSSLNIWKFMVHILLMPGLENFEHYFASMWNECNCAVVWTLFDIAFLWNWNENWPLQFCGHCWVFQKCWYTECSTFTASSFRIWSSTGIPSPPLLEVMLPKAHLDEPRWILDELRILMLHLLCANWSISHNLIEPQFPHLQSKLNEVFFRLTLDSKTLILFFMFKMLESDSHK